MRRLVLLAGLLVACSRRVPVSLDASMPSNPSDTTTAIDSAHVDAIDPPMTVRKGEGVSITFVGANGSNGIAATKTDPGAAPGVGMVFRLDNETGEERRIVGEMDAHVVTLTGLSGDIVTDPKILKQCIGIVPPHGRFVCSLIYNFGSPGSEAPRELRVGVAGAWFHVAVTVKAGAGQGTAH